MSRSTGVRPDPAPAHDPDFSAKLDRGAMDTEVWGYCTTCERWFYCEHAPEPTDRPHCPVCAETPARLDRRQARRAG